MKKILVLLAIVAMSSGCVSYAVTSKHNAAQKAKLVRVIASDNAVRAEVNLTEFNTGYFAAWGAHPWQMAGATLVDAATTWGVYKVADNNKWLPWEDYDKATPTESTATDAGATSAAGGMAVNGSDNVVINVSNGGSVTVYQDSPITTTSGGE